MDVAVEDIYRTALRYLDAYACARPILIFVWLYFRLRRWLWQLPVLEVIAF